MQIINKGQNNFLIFTLSEKVTLTNPYYLFTFKHQVLMSSVNFIASDVPAVKCIALVSPPK